MNDSDRPLEGLIPVTGLGASAGGLVALQQFFDHTPPRSGMAFVVVVHLSPDRESHFAELLQMRTIMPVIEVERATHLEPDHVYVIPPDSNLSTVDGRVELRPRPPSGQNRTPIDLFFRSLAETHGPQAAAVVFSGTGSDGAEGLRRIKEAGGLTLVQDPAEAEQQSMPLAAIRTGMVDRVLGAAALGPELLRLRRSGSLDSVADGDSIQERPLRAVFAELKRRTGHDFGGYKLATVTRRLRRRMHLAGADDVEKYLTILRADAAEVDALQRDLLITVTSFFRDPPSFAALETTIVPGLFTRHGGEDAVRVWVAGCATGEEAYSVAILLKEHADRVDPAPPIQIFASDPSEHAFDFAREGLYPEGIVADVSEERLERHFTREAGGFRVRPSVRELVLFASHDLLSDPPFSRVDLVVCRNVLIYLQREAQRRVLEVFHYALRPNGHLFLGGAESVGIAEDLYEAVDGEHRIYRRRSVPRIQPPLLSLRRRGSGLPDAAAQESAADVRALSGLHQRLLEAYAPPSLVVNASYDIVHLSERAGRYLRHGAGQPSMQLLDMVDGELRLELRRVLSAAFRKGDSTVAGPVPGQVDGRPATLRLTVRPLVEEDGPRHALVVFEELPLAPSGTRSTDDGAADSRSPLEIENERLRAQLQAVNDDNELAIQRYQAANEELQSVNEEQRATSEELETSKEEIESVNEELRTLNQEYRSKIEEMGELNADLRNLIDSTDVATIFLNRDLTIRRFTPTVPDLFNFKAGDVGRQIDDVTNRLDYPELTADARKVIATLTRIEREVPAEGGRWITVRLAPYRSLEDRIDGVVLTFIDGTERKRAELERERLLQGARAADAVKSELLALLSQDFRTPLQGLVGYAELLGNESGGPLNPTQRSHVQRIRGVADQLGDRVEELLTHARQETDEHPPT